MPIGFHPTGNTALKDNAGRRYVGHANFHPIAHAIRNPVELMGAIASLTTGGVMERHPKLRAAFLEGTAGWLHWWLWRLDDQWESSAPAASAAVDAAERILQAAMLYRARRRRGAGGPCRQQDGRRYFVVSSDYPHSDGAFPDAMKEFFGMPFNAEARHKILWDNCARLYRIETPSGSLTQPVPQVSAAE